MYINSLLLQRLKDMNEPTLSFSCLPVKIIMNQRNMTGQFTNRSRLLRLQMSENKRLIRQRKNNELLGACILGFLFALIVMSPGKKAKITSPQAIETKVEVKAVEVTPTPKKLNWNDAIREIFPADEAGKMIRICMTENKSQNPYAMNVNNNKSYDYSWCQVNSIHKPKSMTHSEWMKNLEDPMFNALQVRKIYLSQGWNAWVVYNKGLVK